MNLEKIKLLEPFLCVRSLSRRSKTKADGSVVKKVFVMFFVFFSAFTPLLQPAFETEGTLGIGVRAMAMGGAGVALVGDPYGFYWNPALPISLARFSAALSYESVMQNYRTREITAYPVLAFPTGAETITLASSYLEMQGVSRESIYFFGYAFPVWRGLCGGFNFKHYRGIYEFAGARSLARGWGFDLGTLYRLKLPRPEHVLDFGLSLINIGARAHWQQLATEESLKSVARAGVCYRYPGDGSLAVEANYRREYLLSGRHFSFRLGVERWFFRHRFALRAGMVDFISSKEKYSGGVGFQFRDMYLSYAYLNRVSSLGSTHRISMEYSFQRQKLDLKLKPKLFSPNGDRVKDEVKILLVTNLPLAVEDYRVVVRNKLGKLVRDFSGQGRPPEYVLWDGRRSNGGVAADGEYKITYQINYSDGKSMKTQARQCVLDTEPPVVNAWVPDRVVELVGKGRGKTVVQFNLEADDKNGVQEWRLEISNMAGRVIKSFSREGRVRHSLKWNGCGESGALVRKNSLYRYVLKATDNAGNEGVAYPPFLMVKGERRKLLSLTSDLLKRGVSINVTSGSVLFDTGQAEIKPGGESSLLRVGKILAEYPEVVVIVEGHTDNVPIHTAKFKNNQELSEGRSKSVVSLLVQKMNVDPSRVYFVGHGASKPIDTNARKVGRAKNRRIEVVISVGRDAIKEEYKLLDKKDWVAEE